MEEFADEGIFGRYDAFDWGDDENPLWTSEEDAALNETLGK